MELGANFLQYSDWIERIVGDDYDLQAVTGGAEVDWLDGAKLMYNASIWDVLNDYVAPKDPNVVELGCQVTLVDYSLADRQNGEVIVRCANGRSFAADHVIVTVSLQILGDRDITFVPSFDVDEIYESHPCPMIDGVKFFMEFTELFFPGLNCRPLGPCGTDSGSEHLYFDYTSASPGLSNGNYIMVGYIIGSPAQRFIDMSNDDIIDELIDTLDQEFDGLARDSYVKGFVKNWSKDPFVKGAYANCGYYDFDNNPAGALPINNKVWIAGEAFPIEGDTYGWVDAGAFSGDDAAKQILRISEGTNVPDTIFWSRVESATPVPTPSPTQSPVASPTDAPVTPEPTFTPTKAPVTPEPTFTPTKAPVTPEPTSSPTLRPTTKEPTPVPTESPVTPAPTDCLPDYEMCTINSDCCSNRCLSGLCRARSTATTGREDQKLSLGAGVGGAARLRRRRFQFP